MKAVIRTVLIIILVLAAAAGGGAWYIWNGMQPVEPAGPAVTVTIEKGMGSSQIADLLEQEGIIRNGLFFKGYLKWVNEGSSFKAGTYNVSPGESYDTLISRMNAGDVVKEETVVFTIPEGYTAVQVAERLAAAWNQKPETFLGIIDSGTGLEAVTTLGIPENKELRHRLEGYLFPETYELAKDSTPQEVIEAMLEQLVKKLDTLPEWKAKLANRGLSLHELLTVASLVEREVVVDTERPLVAGVIYNRLDKGQKLEIDATVQYLLDKQKERLYEKDLQVENPYNTYKTEGLPPGPISSPGLASIEAALTPEVSEYFFYVTKKDGTQGHLFAKTYKEHLANIEKSKQNQ
ncbi:endolytic transglycosylase MltG [Paenibacillus sp. MMS20-IR301]|uniref:endolytic transglycosylase MltG n=1 Tax=Paenibacillus sp. MMS20-IR301 TaxID=2895946 RepID=UPI0028E98226|nr:endolytic transglycosylase MltG [Paenibacillus sp. MMS20-IR301]WNS46646.1 endolytic transglycosylase MltG [Paenibacillus sp. MMS20-IR301]